MGEIREDESDVYPLPFNRGAYGVIISYEDKRIKEETYKDMDAFFGDCKKLTKAKIPFRVYGIWNGKWRTDLFILDWKLLKKRYKEL